MPEQILVKAPPGVAGLHDLRVTVREVTVGQMKAYADEAVPLTEAVEAVEGYDSVDDLPVRLGVMLTKGLVDYFSGEEITPEISAISSADTGKRPKRRRDG